MFVYDITKSSKKGDISLQKVNSKCLFLDEIIDIKFISKDRVLVCSNNEYLKLLDLNTGDMELYEGHTDIILCLDTC